MANIFNLPSAEQFDVANALLASIASNVGAGGIEVASWRDVQRLTRMGLHQKMFTYGDQFQTTYNSNPFIQDVIGINHDIPTDKRFEHSLTLQFHACLDNVQFSAPQALYNAETELPAGEHIFTLASKKYKVATGQVVPEGGQLYINAWQSSEGEGQYVPTKITTYDDDRRTAIESSLTVESIETGVDTLTPVNHHQRCRYGSNNYLESAIRQWLNSEDDSFAWKPMTKYDRPSTAAPYTGPGFLKLLDPDLVAVLGAVDKQVARNTVTDSDKNQDFFSDKIFLLSRVEVFSGAEGTTTGEKAYPYYSALSANATTDALTGRIKYLNDSARHWWLRSPFTGYAHHTRRVSTTGSVNHSYAGNASGAAPACCIV